MGPPSMYSLIGLAEGTQTTFNCFDKLEGYTLLLFACVTTDRAAFTNLGHGPVSCRYRMLFHKMLFNWILSPIKTVNKSTYMKYRRIFSKWHFSQISPIIITRSKTPCLLERWSTRMMTKKGRICSINGTYKATALIINGARRLPFFLFLEGNFWPSSEKKLSFYWIYIIK